MRLHAMIDKSHGHIEKRSITTSTLSLDHANWRSLIRFLRIGRDVTANRDIATSVTYTITNLTETQDSAENLLRPVRGG